MPAFCRCEGDASEVRDPIDGTLRCLRCGRDVRPLQIAPSTWRLALAIASALMDSGSKIGAARNPARVVSPPGPSGLLRRDQSFGDHA